MTIQTMLACPLPVHSAHTHLWETFAKQSAPRFHPAAWVRLLHPPTAFSFDEAWLLCECAENTWLAWIPDYGEIVLRSDEIDVA
jgi:hypothetical protein